MEGTAQKIEKENKEYQKTLEDATWKALETSSSVAVKIENGSYVLPYVAATFRNAGFEVSYNPDEQLLSVRKENAPQPQNT